MHGCEKCKDLNQMVSIAGPGDLKNAVRVAKDNVSDKTISVLESESGDLSRPFNELSSSGAWDDAVYYVFICNYCGQRFLLSVETYHGAGGKWKPL